MVPTGTQLSFIEIKRTWLARWHMLSAVYIQPRLAIFSLCTNVLAGVCMYCTGCVAGCVGASRMGIIRVSFAVVRSGVTPKNNVLLSTTRACDSIPLLLCATRYSLCPERTKRVPRNRAEKALVQLGHVRSIFPVSVYVLVATLAVDCRVVGIKASVSNCLRLSSRVVTSYTDNDPLQAHPENRSAPCLWLTCWRFAPTSTYARNVYVFALLKYRPWSLSVNQSDIHRAALARNPRWWMLCNCRQL